MYNNIPKNNWFPTLNDSLASEGVLHLWTLGSNIAYGETVRHIVEDGAKLILLSVYRNTKGYYERVIHYQTN